MRQVGHEPPGTSCLGAKWGRFGWETRETEALWKRLTKAQQKVSAVFFR